MNFDVRKISLYFREVHSRYYIDTNGIIYTSIKSGNTAIMIDGKRKNINNFLKNNLKNMNNTNKIIISIPETENKYFLLNNGEILQRLSTRINEIGVVDVCLIRIDGNSSGNRYKVHRLLAGCFLGDIENKEVHHKDGNRKNNNLLNLEILTFEEHRGKQNYKKNHNISIVETIPQGSRTDN